MGIYFWMEKTTKGRQGLLVGGGKNKRVKDNNIFFNPKSLNNVEIDDEMKTAPRRLDSFTQPGFYDPFYLGSNQDDTVSNMIYNVYSYENYIDPTGNYARADSFNSANHTAYPLPNNHIGSMTRYGSNLGKNFMFMPQQNSLHNGQSLYHEDNLDNDDFLKYIQNKEPMDPYNGIYGKKNSLKKRSSFQTGGFTHLPEFIDEFGDFQNPPSFASYPFIPNINSNIKPFDNLELQPCQLIPKKSNDNENFNTNLILTDQSKHKTNQATNLLYNKLQSLGYEICFLIPKEAKETIDMYLNTGVLNDFKIFVTIFQQGTCIDKWPDTSTEVRNHEVIVHITASSRKLIKVTTLLIAAICRNLIILKRISLENCGKELNFKQHSNFQRSTIKFVKYESKQNNFEQLKQVYDKISVKLEKDEEKKSDKEVCDLWEKTIPGKNEKNNNANNNVWPHNPDIIKKSFEDCLKLVDSLDVKSNQDGSCILDLDQNKDIYFNVYSNSKIYGIISCIKCDPSNFIKALLFTTSHLILKKAENDPVAKVKIVTDYQHLG